MRIYFKVFPAVVVLPSLDYCIQNNNGNDNGDDNHNQSLSHLFSYLESQ